MHIFWEVSLGDFLLVTVFLGGGAAYLTGRAVALTWRPLLHLALFIVVLTCGVRFIHYALFGGTLLSIRFYLVDLVVLGLFALLGFRWTRAGQMTGQYSWLFRRTSRLTWASRPEASAGTVKDG